MKRKTKAELVDLLRRIVQSADRGLADEEQLAAEVRRSLIEEAREASGLGKAQKIEAEED